MCLESRISFGLFRVKILKKSVCEDEAGEERRGKLMKELKGLGLTGICFSLQCLAKSLTKGQLANKCLWKGGKKKRLPK